MSVTFNIEKPKLIPKQDDNHYEKYRDGCIIFALLAIGFVGILWGSISFHKSWPFAQAVTLVTIGSLSIISTVIAIFKFTLKEGDTRMTSSVYRHQKSAAMRSLEYQKDTGKRSSYPSSDGEESSNKYSSYAQKRIEDHAYKVATIKARYPWPDDTTHITDRELFERMQRLKPNIEYNYDKFIAEDPEGSEYYKKTIKYCRTNLDIWCYATQDAMKNEMESYNSSCSIL